MRRMLAIVIACLLSVPVWADIPVDVELVLAVDVSRSMTPRELEIQRQGYAAALTSPDVIQAIQNGPNGQVALTFVEWAGTGSQRVIVDWTLVRGREDAEAFARQLAVQFDTSLRRTSISGALSFASGLFRGNGFTSLRQVIDISGDGPNNQGGPVVPARDRALAQGITINGLPLMTREGLGMQWHLDDLDRYYRHCVIGGPGAFVIPVLEWDHFPDAVRRKLILELVGRPRSKVWRMQYSGAREGGYDCLIGEKIWDEIMNDSF